MTFDFESRLTSVGVNAQWSMGVDRCEMRIEIDSGSQRRRGNNCVAVRDLMDRKVPSNVERWAFVRRMQNAPEWPTDSCTLEHESESL